MRNASKLVLGIVCLVVALFFVCMLMVGAPKNTLETPLASEASETPSPSSIPAESEPIPESQASTKMTRYIVKGESRGICVYEEGQPEPTTVIEMDLSTLPTVDQELLKDGIRISSKEDLGRLLEDFCS